MKYISIFVILTALLITGCSQKVVHPTERATQPSVTEKGLTGSGDGSGISEEELARRERERQLALQRQNGEIGLSDVSFDYDSYVVNSSEIPKVEAAGNWLKSNSPIKLIVEGHCDERGTMEYNLALGQKRADAVKDYLIKMGNDPKRIRSISFGKETPVDPGHDENAWARNRRVHFKADRKE